MQGFRNKNDIPQGGIHYGQIVPAYVRSLIFRICQGVWQFFVDDVALDMENTLGECL